MALDDGGVELELSADYEHESASESPSIQGVDRDVDHDREAPFAWLEGGDLPSLAAMLEREHLSTVAVVLSYLAPKQASQLLTLLPFGRRAAALERLADLGESDRASLEVIEKGLAKWIAERKIEQQRKANRLSSVKAILQHSTQAASQTLLAEIAGHDQELAKRLGAGRSASPPPRAGSNPLPRSVSNDSTSNHSTIAAQAASLTGVPAPRREMHPTRDSQSASGGVSGAEEGTDRKKEAAPRSVSMPQFEFSRLTSFGRKEIALLFQQSQAECVVLALAGATEEVTAHVERQLPRNISKELRRRMHNLPAIRLSDVTAAQKQIGHVAARLIASGRLSVGLAAPNRSATPMPAHS